MLTTDTVECREFCLASRPSGEPTGENFTLATRRLGPLEDGEVLVKNALMSVDPYMRGRMNAGRSYLPPFEVGAPLDGAAIGTVAASKDPSRPVGTTVLHNLGWREYAVLPGKATRPIDVGNVPPEVYLSALGGTGFTAWVGLRIIGRVVAGETIFVSAAAGAVGSMAVQLAKRWGLRVIGSASTPEKAAYVRDTLGADAAFDYHARPVRESLREAAPDGIDVYFDNVGGEQLEAAIGAMRDHGRAVLCGAVSQYNSTTPAVPRNFYLAIGRRLRLEGFIVFDHNSHRTEFFDEVAPLVASGAIHAPVSFVDGFENAPQALMDLLQPNARVGKVVVRLS
jgi:NADPH-dependent curcumin reductase CurA